MTVVLLRFTGAASPRRPASRLPGGASAAAAGAFLRMNIAIFTRIVRICGVTMRSIVPSVRDFMSARIITVPARSPRGPRIGRKMAMRPSSIPNSK